MTMFIASILCIVAGVAAATSYVVYWRDLSRAHGRLVGDSRLVVTSFGVLEYAIKGEGTPTLVIHGACGGFDQSLQMAGPLAQRGYQLIAPSRFGYLRSAHTSGLTTAKQADAYAQLLDSLGVGRAFVVAISAGEWSALQFAIRHPDRCRAMVLIVPADYLPPRTRNYGGALVRAIFGSDFIAWAVSRSASFIAWPMRMMLGTDPELVKNAEPNERARAQEILSHLLPVTARFVGTRFDIETAARCEMLSLDKIACPVLTISAADDEFGTAARAEHIAGEVPGGRALIFASGGHALVGHYVDSMNEITSFFLGSDCDPFRSAADATSAVGGSKTLFDPTHPDRI